MSPIPKYILQKIKDVKANKGKYLSLRYLDLPFIPSEVFEMEHLETLDMTGNRISLIPNDIIHLAKLRTLDLSENNILSLPDSLCDLEHLTFLGAAYNKLNEFPISVLNIPHLSGLDLSNNEIDKIPYSIKVAEKLEELNLSENKIQDFPAGFSGLKHLKKLFLNGNHLTHLPTSICELPFLEVLELSSAKIHTESLDSIHKLKRLSNLNLSGNNLLEIPDSLFSLENLTHLDVSYNLLSDIPSKIKKLRKLSHLNLSNNSLLSIPRDLPDITSLVSLNLDSNQINQIPKSLSKLLKLKSLFLSNNRITKIPEAISDLPELNKLSVKDNPIESPPIEIAYKGIASIRSYHQQIKEGKSRLYEAKLLIVGAPESGKTTLSKKLKDANYQLKKEDATKGIEVSHIILDSDGSKKIRLNIWDFGGQEIYSKTHQFFLSKNSLYVIMTDNRKDGTSFSYWLQTIELLSPGSPVLIVINKRDKEIPFQRGRINRLVQNFPNVKEILETDLESNLGLRNIQHEINKYVKELPLIKKEIPKPWLKVRKILEGLDKKYISLKAYEKICKESGIDTKKEQSTSSKTQALHLSEYLHEIGVFLHYQNNRVLKEIIFLQPKWTTTAVYQILNDEVKNRRGRFDLNYLNEKWSAEYLEIKDQLLELMKEFKLCYSVGNSDQFITPDLLPEDSPSYTWHSGNNLVFISHYSPFLPVGTFAKLLIEFHKNIIDEVAWQNGLLLSWNQAKAEITVNEDKHQIQIRIFGEERRSLLYIILRELESINEKFAGKLSVSHLIPCKCERYLNRENSCKNDGEWDYKVYNFEALKQGVKRGKREITCDKCWEQVNIEELVDEVKDNRMERLDKKDFEKLRTFIREDRLVDAINKISEITKLHSWLRPYNDETTSLMGRYRRNENAFQNNIIDSSVMNKEHAKIVLATLSLMQKIEMSLA